MIKYIDIDDIPVKIFKPSKPVEQVLIAVHGFTGSKESASITHLGEHFEDTNVMVISFDLPNHGKRNNEEPISLQKCLDTLRVIEEYAFFISDKVSYFANSFGAYLTLLHLNEDRDAPISHVILKSPAIYMDEILKKNILPFNDIDFEWFKYEYMVTLKDEKGINIDYKFYRDLNGNCLENVIDKKYFVTVLQGDEDELIDIKKNEMFFDIVFKDKFNLIYFEKAKHSFTEESDKMKLFEIVKNILQA